MKAILLALGLVALTPQSTVPTRELAAAPAAGEADRALVAGSSIVPLDDVATLSVEPNRLLNLEPGIRATRADGAYTLATHDGRMVEIEAGSEKLSLPSPVALRLTEKGWEFNAGKAYPASSVTIRRRQQDDADSNLKSMQESAKKLKSRQQDKAAPNKLRVRWLYGDNPFVQSEVFNSQAILQLTHISPIGF